MIDRKTMTQPTTNVCGQCRVSDHKFLHHIRLGGTFRRLCTSCVLHHHRQSFCSSCLTVYHRSRPENTVFCNKCHSSSHRTCVSPPATAAAGRSHCYICLNPNSLNFAPKTCNWNSNGNQGIDISAARLLLAAAEISAFSMSNAEAAAASEADRRAKDASDTRKRAKEAVNHVLKLMETEKAKNINNRHKVISNGNANKIFKM